MTTAADLIQSAKRWLSNTGRPEINKLTNSENSSDASIQFDFALGSIAPGAVVCADLEEMYVFSVSAPSATVQRGFAGSPAASHSAGALVEVNPLFSNWRILCEINAELAALTSPSNGIYAVDTIDIDVTTASTYNLDVDVTNVLMVQTNTLGPGMDWPRLRRWDVLYNQDTGSFGSGVALQLYEVPSPGRQLRVTYATGFSPLGNLTDDAESAGLPTTAADIPSIGAAARLLSSREARRSQLDAQPEARQAADVPPSTARSAAAQLFALRDRRIKEEAARLSRRYPAAMRPAV